MKVKVKFYPRDFWVGAYLDEDEPKLVICVVPAFPIIITWGACGSFQKRVAAWLVACFGEGTSATTPQERNYRFLEEALELVQACGMTREEVLKLTDYTFNRPPGEPAQEVGGTMTTLAALCLTQGIEMDEAAETELARCYAAIEKIRAKQALKPQGTPLPGGAGRAENLKN